MTVLRSRVELVGSARGGFAAAWAIGVEVAVYWSEHRRWYGVVGATRGGGGDGIAFDRRHVTATERSGSNSCYCKLHRSSALKRPWSRSRRCIKSRSCLLVPPPSCIVQAKPTSLDSTDARFNAIAAAQAEIALGKRWCYYATANAADVTARLPARLHHAFAGSALSSNPMCHLLGGTLYP